MAKWSSVLSSCALPVAVNEQSSATVIACNDLTHRILICYMKSFLANTALGLPAMYLSNTAHNSSRLSAKGLRHDGFSSSVWIELSVFKVHEPLGLLDCSLSIKSAYSLHDVDIVIFLTCAGFRSFTESLDSYVPYG